MVKSGLEVVHPAGKITPGSAGVVILCGVWSGLWIRPEYITPRLKGSWRELEAF